MIDPSRSYLSPTALLELVEAVAAGSKNDEAGWLEWKSAYNLKNKGALAKVARAILGMANRMPEVAARWADGFGYVLIGVDPDSRRGVEEIDKVVLEDRLAPYLGGAPRWHAEWIPVDGLPGRSVLVLVVQPPRPGDPIYLLRKQAERMPEGAVFVRAGSATRLANASDMEGLQARLLARSQQVAVRVCRSDAGAPIHVLGDRNRATQRLIDVERDRYQRALDNAQRGGQRRLGLAATGLTGTEFRSVDEYLTELLSYMLKYRAWLAAQCVRLFWQDLAFRLEVVNPTVKNFEQVQVTLALPATLGARYWDQVDVDRPRPPKLWGAYLGPFPAAAAPTRDSPHRSGPVISRDGNEVHVRFEPVHLEPHGTVDLDAIAVLSPLDLAGSRQRIGWSATARNADGVAEGSFDLQITPGVIDPRAALEQEIGSLDA